MKYSQVIGIGGAILLIIACFLPWTWHPDLNKTFNGFFSQNNIYGRPGKVFIVLGLFAAAFFAIPAVWAKRWNLLITAITAAFAIKSFILFSGCYKGICPEKKTGLWLMLLASVLMLAMAMFPDVRLKAGKKTDNL